MDIKKLIEEMTLEEKAGQLYQTASAYLRDTTAENTGVINDLGLTTEQLSNVGSVLNFVGANEAKAVCDQCMRASTTKIPIIFMQDVIHGYKTIYPISLAMAGTFDVDLYEDCSEMAAKEASAGGAKVTFAPMVDLVRDARWGRVMESAGEDPYLSGVMGRAQIRGFRKGGLFSCVKHFAAYGAAESGRDYNTTDMSEYTLHEFYLRSYEECMKEKPEMVMTSFNMLNGVPLNGHTDLVVDLLRNKWGFNGVVISDYNGVTEMIRHGYAEDMERCAEIALNNEIDIEMVSPSYMLYLPKLVKEGRVSEEKIDRMLYRVLKLKEEAGLFDNPYGSADEMVENKLCLSKEHRALALRAAEKSIVLLKNNGVLPLNSDDKISLYGHMATTKNVNGAGGCNGNIKDSVSVSDGLENVLGYSVDEKDGDIAIACIGETADESGESASKANINLSKDDVDLVKTLRNKGKKVVAIIFAGRPLALTEIEPYCDAILYAWFLGTESGNAIANVLLGKAYPSAKITMSFPRSVGQCPIYYNHFNTGRPKIKDDYHKVKDWCSSYIDEYNSPLYPFGYGLTYTDMALSDLTLSSNVIESNGSITVSVSLKNIGARDGEEVVQLYIRDKFGSVVRPVKELKGFEKVYVKASEEKTVTFNLSEEMLRFYKNKDELISEKGDFDIMVGLNSRDVLTASLKLI